MLLVLALGSRTINKLRPRSPVVTITYCTQNLLPTVYTIVHAGNLIRTLHSGKTIGAKYKQAFRVKKTRGAPMGRPKLELLASNGVHICHAI